jgi:hypothetical protein
MKAHYPGCQLGDRCTCDEIDERVTFTEVARLIAERDNIELVTAHKLVWKTLLHTAKVCGGDEDKITAIVEDELGVTGEYLQPFLDN